MKKIECVIMDWAGTAVDYGCFVPVAAFVESFKVIGAPVSAAETRAHMGLTKIEEVRALFAIDHVKADFRAKYGRDYNEDDVQGCYKKFQEELFRTLEDYSKPIPGVVEVISKLRGLGIKVGSTNGYTREIKIYQQNYTDTGATAEYTLHNAFPKAVEAVDLNGSEATNILEFRVTFAYSHYTIQTLDPSTSTLVDKAMTALENGLTAAADAIMDSINAAAEGVVQDVSEAISTSMENLAGDEDFEALMDGATNFFYDPGGWMNDVAASVGTSIGDVIGDAIDSLTGR